MKGKNVLPDVEKENPEAFSQKGTKKILTEKESRGIKEEDKILKNMCFDSFYFRIKMIFDRSGGIEPGIKKVLKTSSTDRKESN